MTRLRLAETSDVPEIVQLGEDMLTSSSFAPMGYSREKVAAFVQRVIDSGFAAIAATDDGSTAGFILGDVVEPFYSEHRMGVEHVLYVLPRYQGSRAARMLVDAWSQWCIDSGALQVRPGTSAGSAAADRLYTGLGFERVGSLYVMNKG